MSTEDKEARARREIWSNCHYLSWVAVAMLPPLLVLAVLSLFKYITH